MVQGTPSLLTDQSQAHQNAVNENFPPSGLHLCAPVVSARRTGEERKGRENGGEAGHRGGKAVGVGIRLSLCL